MIFYLVSRGAVPVARTPWRNVMHINVTATAICIGRYQSECLCSSYGQEYCRQPAGSRRSQPAELDRRAVSGQEGQNAGGGNGEGGRAIFGCGGLP